MFCPLVKERKCNFWLYWYSILTFVCEQVMSQNLCVRYVYDLYLKQKYSADYSQYMEVRFGKQQLLLNRSSLYDGFNLWKLWAADSDMSFHQKIAVFWDMTPDSLEPCYFVGGTCCHHLQSRRSYLKIRGGRFVQNFGDQLWNYMGLHPRKP